MGKFKSKKRDIDQESSDLFLEELQASMADAKAQGETWEKPWFTVSVEAPTSGSTGKEYKGMNWWNLNLIANRYGWQGLDLERQEIRGFCFPTQFDTSKGRF